MAAYAEAVRESLDPGAPEPALPTDTGWIVLTHGDLSPRRARRLFPSPPRLLILGGGSTRAGARGVTYARIEPGPPPRLSQAVRAEAARGFGAIVFLDGAGETSGRLLLELAHLGATRCAWRDTLAPCGDPWVVRPTRFLALSKPLRRVADRVLRFGPTRWARARIARARAHEALRQRNALTFPGEHEWLEHLARVGSRVVPRARADRLKVVLYVGTLNSGGAERQLCNLALALRQHGHEPRVLSTYPPADEDGHYLHLLRAGGVPAGMAGLVPSRGALRRLTDLGLSAELLGALPEALRTPVLDLAGELLADPPHVLHAWLDAPNIIGAAAGALVGCPSIVLSTRNVNPTHFPAFYQRWMDPWYRFLVALPQVHLLANSVPGAEDYAAWLGVSPGRLEVIRNGVDLAHMAVPGAQAVRGIRAACGVADGQPLVAGVFRLAAEKQPLLFLDVVSRARAAIPELRVAMVGIGPLRAQVEQRITALGLQDAVVLLGQRTDVPAILAASQALLLTSRVEGTPNVVLEAQWLGCPPVATAVGGTPDALLDGVTGVLRGRDDAAGLAEALVSLLRDDARRADLARAGRDFVQRRFALPRMFEEHLAFYRRRHPGLVAHAAPAPGLAAR